MKRTLRWLTAAVLAAGVAAETVGCATAGALREEQARRAEAEARQAEAEARLRAAERRIERLETTPKATATETPKAAAEVVVPAPAPEPAKKAAKAAKSETAARPVGTASEAARALRVGLAVDDGREAGDPSTLKQALTSRVEGALAEAGFRMAVTGPFEVGVTVALRAREVNARGSRVVWNGDADVRVIRAAMQNPVQDAVAVDAIARSWTDVASGEARGADAAQKKLAEALAAEVAPFVAEAAERAGARLRVSEVTVQKAWAPKDAAGYPTKFAATVLAMPGVYRCEVTGFDKKAQVLRADVVYDAEAYPDGFVNRLQQMRELGFNRAK